jgi:hypothetical protein
VLAGITNSSYRRNCTVNTPRILRIIQIIFLGVGLLFLLVGIGLFVHTRHFVATAQHAGGTVVSLELVTSNLRSRSSSPTWAPRVQFATPDGQTHEFVSTSSSNPPSYGRGEHVGVLFDPARPEIARIDSFFSLWGAPLIFTVLGGVFVLIMGVVMLALRRGAARNATLLRTGTRIEARFQSVEQNTSMTVNGRHPYRILTQWQDPQSSRLYLFESGNLWFDPISFIQQETIPVYIEAGNPKHYCMDISFLPKPA